MKQEILENKSRYQSNGTPEQARMYARDASHVSAAIESLYQEGVLHEFDDYLREVKKYQPAELQGVGSRNLDSALAAMERTSQQGTLWSNGQISFEEKLALLQQQYGAGSSVSRESALAYMILHELGHNYQDINTKNPEAENDRDIADFAKAMMDKYRSDPKMLSVYQGVFEIAQSRLQHSPQSYRSIDTYVN